MTKGLEALEKIENEYSIDEAVFYKEEFKQVRKELKALEIIREKSVVVEWFTKKRENEKYFTLEVYNAFIPVERQLTEEELELLKEVFKYE